MPLVTEANVPNICVAMLLLLLGKVDLSQYRCQMVEYWNIAYQENPWRYYIWRPGCQKRRLVGNIKFIIIFIFRRKFVH